jgi:hypothetical protein
VNLKPFISSIPDWCIKFVDVPGGLKTGQSWQISFDMANKDHQVKVTLVWTDFPALPDKYPSFVNYLDLIVSDPDGKDHHRNVFSQPYDGKLDAIITLNLSSFPIRGRESTGAQSWLLRYWRDCRNFHWYTREVSSIRKEKSMK